MDFLSAVPSGARYRRARARAPVTPLNKPKRSAIDSKQWKRGRLRAEQCESEKVVYGSKMNLRRGLRTPTTSAQMVGS